MLHSQLKRLDEWLWSDSHGNRRTALRVVLRYVRILSADLGDVQITMRAMGLVYISLLSMVPMLALAFSLLKALGVHNEMESLLLQMLAPLGDGSVELTANIIGFVENVKVGVLGSIGICLLIYAAVNLIQKVEGGLNFIWRVNSPRSLARRFSEYLSVLLVGPVIISSVMAFTASATSHQLTTSIAQIEPFGFLLLVFSRVLPFLLICGGFTFLYIFIPNTQVKFRAAAIGGLFAGSLWQLASWLFAEFVKSSSNYDAVYSGFAIVIFLLIWLYVTWMILLLGARMSFLVQHPEYLLPKRNQNDIGGLLREGLALSIMTLIADSFIRRKQNWRENAIARHLRMPPEETYAIIDRLHQAGYLEESAGDVPRLMPARDPATITVDEIINVVRGGSNNQAQALMNTERESRIKDILKRTEQARADALQGLTLRDMIVTPSDQENDDSSKNTM